MNTIVFDKNRFDSEDEFYDDVKRAIQLLVENGYDVSFRYEDAGIHVMEFDHNDPMLATHSLCWLNDAELNAVYTCHDDED